MIKKEDQKMSSDNNLADLIPSVATILNRNVSKDQVLTEALGKLGMKLEDSRETLIAGDSIIWELPYPSSPDHVTTIVEVLRSQGYYVELREGNRTLMLVIYIASEYLEKSE